MLTYAGLKEGSYKSEGEVEYLYTRPSPPLPPRNDKRPEVDGGAHMGGGGSRSVGGGDGLCLTDMEPIWDGSGENEMVMGDASEGTQFTCFTSKQVLLSALAVLVSK
jgi:hypothetical protein